MENSRNSEKNSQNNSEKKISRNSMLRNRTYDDEAASIDNEFDEAYAKIDWKRRKAAETDIVKWVNTYCVPLMLNDAPPLLGEEVLVDMCKAITSHSNYCILMPRGHGKTSYVECVTLYALATGLQKYVVVISNNARAAAGIMSDIYRAIAEKDTPFSNDYPEISFPFQFCNGCTRRRQTYRGQNTELQKNASNIVFAKLKKDDSDEEYPTSGSVLTCRGVTSGLRGMKYGKLRPTCALLDDLQTSETAENEEAVEKLMSIIRKDIVPLAGAQRLSILQTATQICQDDLVDKLKNDKAWKCKTYKAVLKFPTNLGLWEKYFNIYDAESVSTDNHQESLDFYLANQAEMDEGSEVFNPKRFSKSDGHVSCIQKMMELRHSIGEAAFQAEYQMSPLKATFSLDITPKDVCAKICQRKHLDIPDGYIFVAASTDLNVSYALTTTIIAFKRDMSSLVIHHSTTKCRIDLKLNETAYNAKVYEALVNEGKKLASFNIKLDGWSIDAGGRNWSTVCAFAQNSVRLVGIPACAMAGKASHIFNPYIKSRLRNAIGRTVLCGDQAEQQKSGSGQKYMFFDSDFYRETAQKALLAPQGSIGGCELYNASPEQHSEFAIQVTNEKLKFIKHKQDGRDEYFWTTKEPHDYLDTLAMCYATAASQGLSSQLRSNVALVNAKKQTILLNRRKIKVV